MKVLAVFVGLAGAVVVMVWLRWAALNREEKYKLIDLVGQMRLWEDSLIDLLRRSAYTCGMSKTETMGQRLQRLRVELGMTQAQVAEAAGIPLSSLQGWEVDRREPGARALCRLAKVLRVTVEQFCDTVPVEEVGKAPRPAGPTKAAEPTAKRARGRSSKK